MNINTGHIKIFKRYFRSLSVLTFVLFLSLFSGDKTSDIQFINIPHFDKLVHFGMYFILTFFLFFDLQNNKKKPIKKYILSVLIIIIIFSGIIELIQENYISGRFGSFYDLLANIFGSVMGVVVYFNYKKTKI